MRESTAARPQPKGWRRASRRGSVAAVTVVLLFSAFVSVYGVQTHMAQTAAREAARDMQIALATGAALVTSEVLFVPEHGNVCRRRLIDNTTWTMRDGGVVECDEAASWNVSMPTREQNVERRIGAIRSGFQTRSGGKGE